MMIQFVTSGGSNSYLSIFYQFVNSMRFTGDENQDVDNYLTVRQRVKRLKILSVALLKYISHLGGDI